MRSEPSLETSLSDPLHDRPTFSEQSLNKVDWLVGAFLLVAVFISKAAVLNLPYHWDEIGYASSTHWLISEGLWRIFPGTYPPTTFFGHPPGLFLSLAGLQSILGESTRISHLVALSFSFLGVLFTYLLTSHLFDRATGLLAAFFLFTSTIYYSQAVMFLGDIPVTALGVMSVYFYLKRKHLAYLVCAIYLATLKETSLAILFSVFTYALVFEGRAFLTQAKWLPYALPLLVIAAFLALQKAITGTLVPNPFFSGERSALDLHPMAILVSFAKVFGWILGAQHRWALSLVVILGLYLQFQSLWRREFLLFTFIVTLFVGAFSVIYVLPRYLLPTFPFLCLAASASLTALIRRPLPRFAVGAAICLLCIAGSPRDETRADSFSENMQYVDVVVTHQDAARYIETHLGDRTVLALWPFSKTLTSPFLGYVQKQVRVTSERHDAAVVVYSPQATNEEFSRWIKEKSLKLIRRFERNGKVVELYKGPAWAG